MPGFPGTRPGSARHDTPSRAVSPISGAGSAKSGTPSRAVSPVSGASGINVRGIQNHLRKQGYKVKVTGELDTLTKSALADYLRGKNIAPALKKALGGFKITGRRDPKAWNRRNLPQDYPNSYPGEAEAKKPGNAGKSSYDHVETIRGSDVYGPAAAGGSPGVISLAATAGAGPQFSPIAPGALPPGPRLMDEASFMERLAASYEPVLSTLRSREEAARRAAESNAAETQGWFKQVVGSLGKAAERDRQLNAAALDATRSATAGILSSIGGEANPGASVVGAAGAEAAGTLAALGTAQEQYNEDMRPLLQGEGAGLAARVRSAGQNRAADLAARIAEVMSGRAQAQTEAMFNIAQLNNQIRQQQAERAMTIRQYNDQLKQQEFQNQLALGEAQMAAMLAGSRLAGATGAESYPFAKAPMTVINRVIGDSVASIQGMPYPQALQTVNQILRSYGWSITSPGVKALRNKILAEAGIKVDPRTP